MKRALTAALALALVAACGSSNDDSAAEAELEPTVETTAEKVDISLSVLALDATQAGLGAADCANLSGRQGEIRDGAQARLVNGSGDVIAVTELTGGANLPDSEIVCLWEVVFNDAPADEDVYGAVVGSWESDLVPADELDRPLIIRTDQP